MKKVIVTFLALAIGITSVAQTFSYPFQNPELPRQQRIDDLIGRMTLEEKVAFLMNGSEGIERLGIPEYNWWNEALHGVARAGVATVFPQAIGMAAMFDPEEHEKTFSIISDEARAKYNEAIRRGQHLQYLGLSFWTPNINIFRDPRWGRGQETYGEDPYLTSVIGMAAVRGLQGNDDNYYKLHACAKHFAVHSGPESLRHSFDAVVSQRDLWETYLPAFKALVTEADVQEVMGAYNRYEGVPCCGSDLLLMDILRNRWNYQGLVVSDCGAITDFFKPGAHGTHTDAASASADAVKAGTDIECGSNYKTLVEAVERGIISETDIDVAVRRVLKGRFELGMFDPVEMLPWADIPYSVVACDEHNAQARKVARQSMVLLKNNDVLPIRRGSVRKIAVIGPNAADSTLMLGNYNGDPTHVITVLQGIRNAYPDAEVTYERGCDHLEGFTPVPKAPRAGMNMAGEWEGVPAAGESGSKKVAQKLPPMGPECYTDEAIAALAARAAEADVIVFAGGITPALEGEELGVHLDGFAGGDRSRIELPAIQGKVLKALHSTGKPVVFVLCTGSAIALAQNEADYDALVVAWYGGQEGGNALGDVLTGDYNPSGKLPVTFYKSTSQLPDFTNYDMNGRTYRYMTEPPLYAFGYGMSYTSFKFGKARLSSKKIKRGKPVTVKLKVSNVGAIDGAETVQVYVKRLNDAAAPVMSLKGFQKARLAAGKSVKLKITLPAEAFEYYDVASDGLAVKSGDYQILVGTSSADTGKPLSLRIK
ncbi:MAG: glycoside hydrolase family 3 C-terminal domain-containing protein [Bacteroidales bacterium]|nr:glycoside hydrolase family 3 C-terminal domain-containing protein [Bacteroidales bacterium]